MRIPDLLIGVRNVSVGGCTLVGVKGAVDEDTFRIRVRSVLPYDLRITSSRVRADPDARVLEARLTGDLTGFSRWLISDAGNGSRLVFEEDVVANKALLRRLGVVARPAFRANQALMMRSGRRGLRAYVAGLRRGRSS